MPVLLWVHQPAMEKSENIICKDAEVKVTAKIYGKCPLQPLSAIFTPYFVIFDVFVCANPDPDELPISSHISINIPSTHGIIHVQNHAVGILEDYTGACSCWVKIPLRTQTHSIPVPNVLHDS